MGPSSNWSSLPEEILLNILSRYKDDFLFRLAAMGVCKEWRGCSRWVGTLSLVISYDMRCLMTKRCNKHEKELWQCGCIRDSLSMIMNGSHGIKSLVVKEDWGKLVLGVLDNADWTRLHCSLEMISLSIYCMLPHGDSKLLHNISSCTRLSAFELQLFTQWVVPPQWPVLEGLKVCKMRNVMFTGSTLEMLVSRCRSLEHLEIEGWHCRLENPMLEAPNLLVLRLLVSSCKTLEVSAPRLRNVYLNSITNFVTEGTSLRKLTLASPTTLTFTGRIINLDKLSLSRGFFWETEESVTKVLKSVQVIKCLKFSQDWPQSISLYNFVVELSGKELKEVEVHETSIVGQAGQFQNGKLEAVQSITIDLIDAGHDSLGRILRLLSLCPNAQRLALRGNTEDFRKRLKLHLEKLICCEC